VPALGEESGKGLADSGRWTGDKGCSGDSHDSSSHLQRACV
jgi:hypothetical protein